MKKTRCLWLLTAAALLLSGCAVRSRVSPGEDAPSGEEPATPVMAAETTEKEAAEIYIRGYMNDMTLRELVGQLFFIRPDALDPNQTQAEINGTSRHPVREVTEELRAALRAYPVGGIALFGKNIADPEQLKQLIAGLQDAAPTPLFIGVDEEGGSVARLADNPAFALPRFESARAVGDSGDPARAETMGRTIGAYLRLYGFNMDFAPVADVTADPSGGVIGDRAFSSDGAVAASMAGAMARGLRQEGIVPVYKHFPGHGNAAGDSHLGPAVTEMTLSEAEKQAWLPYTQNDLNLCAVMAGHIAAPAITGDRTPASLSETMVTEILRGRLGFEGLVITDSMAMGAVAAEHGPGEAAVQAIRAGCDMILMPNGLEEAFDGVLQAAEQGELSRDRLEESVIRILWYKYSMGLL
ncbi:MAG: glycoside hydrolase family 3 protein [Oscillospiraceae bacterium]|nr:glycoside hydrolase family 3 protein [Oscillospiraceae bacterium]